MIFNMRMGFLILSNVSIDGLHNYINPPLFFDSSQDLGLSDIWL